MPTEERVAHTPIHFDVEPIHNTQSLFDVIRDDVWVGRVRWMRASQSFQVLRGWLAPHETPLVLDALATYRRQVGR